MGNTNPELDSADQSLPNAVRALFGIAPTRLVKAVGNYLLSTDHGTFDDSNLRLIAAAAPMLNADHVANLILGLPKTNMDMAIKQPDVDEISQDFMLALTEVPEDLRHVVVADLIKSSTIRMLELCPTDALSEQAKTLLAKHASDVIRKGNWTDVSHIVNVYEDADLTANDLQILDRRFGHHDDVRWLWRHHPATGREILQYHHDRDTEAHDRDELLAHPNAPHEWLWDAIDNGSDEAKLYVSRNPTTTPEMLLAVFQNEPLDISKDAILHANASPAMLQYCIESDDVELRRAAADSHAASHEVLWRALRDDDFETRSNATCNSNATEAMLRERLTYDDSAVKCQAIMRTRSTATLWGRINDDDPEVRSTIVQNVNTTDQMLSHFVYNDKLLRRIVGHPNAGTVSLTKAFQVVDGSYCDEDFEGLAIKIWATRHPNAPEELLLNALDDASLEVRINAAAHPKATQAVIDKALKSGDQEVRDLALAGLDGLDPHDALENACRQPDGSQAVTHDAIKTIRNTVRAIVDYRMTLTPGARPKTWTGLPGLRDVEMRQSPIARQIDNSDFAGYKADIIKTRRDLDALANRMGNCLSGYFDSCFEGKTIIAKFEDPENNEVYAAAWRVEGNNAHLTEINSMKNKHHVPQELEDAVAQVTLTQTIRRDRTSVTRFRDFGLV